MIWVRNVFLKYGLGAKRLSEIWFGCLNYEAGGETFFLFMRRGRNVFPKYEVGAKRLTKKWCELTMGREVCVPFDCVSFCFTNAISYTTNERMTIKYKNT